MNRIIVQLLAISVFGVFPGLKTGFAQATGDSREDFLYGEYYLSQKKYEKALPFYFAALENNPDNCNISYRIGMCYLHRLEDQIAAIPYLEKSVENTDLHYVAGRYKDPAAPPEAWLLLGEAYHRDNQLLKASFAYHEYRRLIGDSDKEKKEIVMQKIAGLGISSEFQRNDDSLNMINMGGIINSRFSDYNPVLSGDEQTLIYTQFWESYDRIMISVSSPEGWSDPKEITREIGSEGDCYTSALSCDGKELYLIRQEGTDYDIYSTRFDSGSWSKMRVLGGKVNSRFRESSVCVSADGTEMYFASDRPEGIGGFDLYRAIRNGDCWTDVQNLGKTVNTKMDEEAPYLSSEGARLYFSSNGHLTVGNMDIFYSDLDETGNWSTPVNIGRPINTTNDELFYVYFTDTKRGYLSADLTDGYGKNDIYVIQEGANQAYKSGEYHSADHLLSSAKNESVPLPDPSEDVEEAMVNLNKLEVEYGGDQITLDFAEGTTPTYTIQIYALLHPTDRNRINLSPLVITEGDDGIHRYTYGEFTDKSEALEKLVSVRELGFSDAFIRNTLTIQNYQGK